MAWGGDGCGRKLERRNDTSSQVAKQVTKQQQVCRLNWFRLRRPSLVVRHCSTRSRKATRFRARLALENRYVTRLDSYRWRKSRLLMPFTPVLDSPLPIFGNGHSSSQHARASPTSKEIQSPSTRRSRAAQMSMNGHL
jgi:hypothetical protein